VDGGEARSDSAAAGVGKEQARGGGEVSVEALEEAEEGHEENELNGPVLAEAMFEGDGGGEAFAEEGLPGSDVGDGDDTHGVEKSADAESEADGLHVACLAKIRVGFFGVLGDGFKTGHEIRNDLQREENGKEWSGVKCGMKICGSAAEGAYNEESEEDQEDHAGHGFLEIRAEADTAVVDGGEKQSERDTEDETREENGLAVYAIELERIERGENVGGNFTEGDGFPGTDDEVSEKHHPAGEVADDRRKNLSGVGGFAGGVGKALDPLAVHIADGEQNNSADGKTERSARGTATAEPVVHKDEPAGADHGAESEGEVIVEAKFASESGHLENAEQFVKEIGGEERSDFAGVVGWGDFHEVATDDVEAAKSADEFDDLEAGEAADLGSAGAGSVGGIHAIDIKSYVDGLTAESGEMPLNAGQTFFVKVLGGDHSYFVGASKIKIGFAIDLTAKANL